MLLILNIDRGEIGKMELPNEYLKNQFTCIEISSLHVNPNIFRLRKTLHSFDIDASHLRFYLSGRSNKNYGIELEDGSIIDSEGLQDLKQWSQLTECQKKLRKENLWLENLPELLKFPNGLLNDTFPVFATQFVSLLQSYGIDKEIQSINLRVAHLKCLVGSRLLCDSFLSWIACKINRESHEAFCIQYLEGFIGGTWNEGLKNNFLKTFVNRTNVKSIVLLLNVGRYVDKRGNYKGVL